MTQPWFRSVALYGGASLVLALLTYIRFQEEPLRVILVGCLLFVLLTIFKADLERQRIPLVSVFLLGLLGGMEQYFFRAATFSSIGISLCIGGIFFVAQYLLSRGRLIGKGDVYLGMALGVTLGGPRVLFAILLSYVVGSVIALGLLAVGRIHRQDRLPLGSFLVVGGICTLFLDQPWLYIGMR